MTFLRRIMDLTAAAIKPRSIAFRLIVAVLAVELVASLATVLISFGYERHLHFHAFDGMLHGHIDSLLGAVQENAEDDLMLVAADVHVPRDDVYQVYDCNGQELGRSTNWQGLPAGAPVVPPDGHRASYFDMVIDGHRYRMVRFIGSRVVDPLKPGGGHRRPVIVYYGGRTKRVWEVIWATVEFYAIGSGVLLLITGPLIAWLLHRGLEPLRQLAAMSATVSVNNWNFDPPERARRTPELAQLTHTLEAVLERLEKSFMQQRIFVSDAAHELKTAVAVVKSTLQLLGLRERSAREYQAGLERSLADVERLEELVSKMLRLARVEAGDQPPSGTPAGNFTLALEQTFAEMESVAEVRGVQLVLNADAAPFMVPLPDDDCITVLGNLLLNALQHSPAGTTITARVTTANNTVLFELEDQGDGISAEALPYVFDRFYRGDPSRNRNTGGTGLGLAICKALVERSGGSIRISSSPGNGTTVFVSLPISNGA